MIAIGAGSLWGAYALITQGTPAQAENLLTQPFLVVAQPARTFPTGRTLALAGRTQPAAAAG
ncbi:MAG: hypothetical protein ACREJ2_05550, partial [Planctomycetota bacterium]